MSPISDKDRGKRLQRLRLKMKPRPTQVDIARAFGIDKAAVSSWETGRSRPAPERVHELDRLLGGTGAVLDLFGVPTTAADPTLGADVAAIRGAVEGIADAVAALTQRVEATAAIAPELVRLVEATQRIAEVVARERLRADPTPPTGL